MLNYWNVRIIVEMTTFVSVDVAEKWKKRRKNAHVVNFVQVAFFHKTFSFKPRFKPSTLMEFFFLTWSFQTDVHAIAGTDAQQELKIGNSKVKASFYYYKIILRILSW